VKLKLAVFKTAGSLAWVLSAPLATVAIGIALLWPFIRQFNDVAIGFAIFGIVAFAGGIGICLGLLLGIGVLQGGKS
jgi:hypothetical protein